MYELYIHVTDLKYLWINHVRQQILLDLSFTFKDYADLNL